ncbi:MAG: hypothetical protein ACR2HY_07905 [Acidimicrobiales bacterium]
MSHDLLLRRLKLLASLVAALVVLAACGTQQRVAKMENVKPPAAGTPAGPADVSGIYRSLHTATLQLRQDGTVALIVPEGTGASSGRFTLQDGRLELQTTACRDAIGSYDVVVTGPQKAGKATLVVTAVDDSCAGRRRDLTRDPWVYADS